MRLAYACGEICRRRLFSNLFDGAHILDYKQQANFSHTLRPAVVSSFFLKSQDIKRIRTILPAGSLDVWTEMPPCYCYAKEVHTNDCTRLPKRSNVHNLLILIFLLLYIATICSEPSSKILVLFVVELHARTLGADSVLLSTSAFPRKPLHHQ
jgi:hypothetical protein